MVKRSVGELVGILVGGGHKVHPNVLDLILSKAISK